LLPREVMWRRLPLVALAVFLAIPPVRHVILNATEHEVDRTTPEWKAREGLIARAQVFARNAPKPTPSDLRHTLAEVTCQFEPKPAKATTPKFDCRLDDGRIVKVKYGHSRERPAEVGATRVLSALGFGGDRVTMVERLMCRGCPPSPFQMRILAEQFLLGPLFDRVSKLLGTREFRWVSMEHKLEGREIEVDGFEGWDWRELVLVDQSKGGATPAELDALRLISVLLAHWDNKAPNHRLVCLGEDPDKGHDPEAPCKTPLLMLQDVGATFGPTKVNYQAWSALPIWKDAATCVVSMETMPYEGILFPPTQISEQGRLLLAGRLRMLSRAEVQAIFESARFPDPANEGRVATDVGPWVTAFEDKVRQIADRPPCPSLP
jgi:hypothetical protein